MIKSKTSRDFELAYELHKGINCLGVTENAILDNCQNKEDYKPRTLIDQTLELIDPTPNIHTLFVQFNARFFWNVLLPVEVKWSNRMTSCAGVCSFHPRNRQCVITLSGPLLKLRPRKDLVETLLHEMIHGYLFLTNNNRDRDGHGPEFCKHMDRINKTAGTKITIYHSFHDEVRLYQQHWWRCNGPCHKRPPYFGTVRRAMNRAPGPSDFWWKEHQQTCGGQFIKIKEPENFKSKNTKNKDKAKPIKKNANSESNISDWLTKNSKNSTSIVAPNFASTPKQTKPVQDNKNSPNGFKKLGNGTNNVFGWGTRGPSGSNSSQTPSTSVSSIPRFVFSSSVLGGSNSGRSNLLNKFDSSNQHHKSPKNLNIKSPKNTIELWTKTAKTKSSTNNDQSFNKLNVKLVKCPICNDNVPADEVNAHIDSCLITTNETTRKSKKLDTCDGNNVKKDECNNSSAKSWIITGDSTPTQKRKNDTDSMFSSKQPKIDDSGNLKTTSCPICNKNIPLLSINEHLDKCLLETSEQDNNSTVELSDSNYNTSKNDSVISISSTSSSNSSSSLTVESPKASCSGSDSRKKDAIKSNLQKCLVCDSFIIPGMSLNDHLEDCIGSVFNDDSTLSSDFENEEKAEQSITQDDKCPCPVCMELIMESSMNDHLDICLKNT